MSRNFVLKYAVLTVVATLVTLGAYGQQYPERGAIRAGNRDYEKQQYADAERSYMEALRRDTTSVEATFNLGDVHYATENFAAAEEQFSKVIKRTEGVTKEQLADAYYNLGNAQFQQQKLQEALESYKESLRLEPDNLETKFNYAYTKAMLDQQQQQQQDNNQQGDNNQQNDQQNDQQDQSQQNNGGEQQEQNGNQNQNQNDQQQQPESQQGDQPQGDKPQPSEGAQQESVPEGPSKESEQVLNAVQAAEDKTRDKVDAERSVGVARSGKNW